MAELKKGFTQIVEPARLKLAISRDEYALCSYLQYRAADPRQRMSGWCCDAKEEIAAFIGVTRGGLYKMVSRLIVEGLIEAGGAVPFVWRVTPLWIDTETDCKQSLQGTVNKVDTKCKQSLQGTVNKVDTHNKVEYDISRNELEREQDKKNSPPPVENSFPLEAVGNVEGENLSGGVRAEIHDPELPGTTVLDLIPPAPITEPPPHRIELGDRPNAETPSQLQKSIEAFYAEPDWKNEWDDGVCRISGVWIPDNPQKESRLKSILSDFCDHCVKNNQQRDTYRQLNAAFQQWVKREKYATWKQPKPGQNVNGEKPIYQRPKNAIY